MIESGDESTDDVEGSSSDESTHRFNATRSSGIDASRTSLGSLALSHPVSP